MIIASDQCVCAGTNTFGTGKEWNQAEDEQFNAGDEWIENARLSISDTHTQLPTHTVSVQRLPNRIYVDMIASHSYSHLRKQAPPVTLRRSKS